MRDAVKVLLGVGAGLLAVFFLKRSRLFEVVTSRVDTTATLPSTFHPSVLGMPDEFRYLTTDDMDTVIKFWVDPASDRPFENEPGMVRRLPISILTERLEIAIFYQFNPEAVRRLEQRRQALAAAGLAGVPAPPLPSVGQA